jgi:hypothetical protein
MHGFSRDLKPVKVHHSDIRTLNALDVLAAVSKPAVAEAMAGEVVMS